MKGSRVQITGPPRKPPPIRITFFALGFLFFLATCATQNASTLLRDATLGIQRKPKSNTLSIRTKYEGLRELFATASAPTAEQFPYEELRFGKCSFQAEPQTLFLDMANTYLDADPALGRSLYLVPTLLGLPQTVPRQQSEVGQISHDQAIAVHRERARLIQFFTTLQMNQPEGVGLKDLFYNARNPSAYVSYSNKSENVGFRLRVATLRDSRSEVWVLEHYCNYILGCQFNNSAERYHQFEPYAYCYYEKGLEFGRGSTTVKSPIDIVNTPTTPPKRLQKEGREIDVLKSDQD